MLFKEMLATVIKDQRKELELPVGLVRREALPEIFPPGGTSAAIVKGIRRCGKSTLLKQFLHERFQEKFFYLNFDDERLMGFEAEDFQKAMETFIEIYGSRKVVFFDEIQNVPGWELFINRLLREGFSVFITGSNANLLSRDLGTHLTGRHLDHELYPFSFREYLASRKINFRSPQGFSTEEISTALREFREYMVFGGMPEPTMSHNPALVGQIVEDIIQKDIIRRHKIRKQNELKNALMFLIRNSANKITASAISGNFGIQSPATAQKYIEYAEESCLVFQVRKYEPKLKQFDKNPRKIYCIDNGIVSRLSPGILEQQGSLLENLVAVELKHRGAQFYYFMNKNGSETDFVIAANGKISEAIQVCLNPSDFSTMQREEKALIRTLDEAGLSKGIIITLEHEQIKKAGNKSIHYVPAWKWLLKR